MMILKNGFNDMTISRENMAFLIQIVIISMKLVFGFVLDVISGLSLGNPHVLCILQALIVIVSLLQLWKL